MGFVADRLLDSALEILRLEGDRLDLCVSEPATYAAATGAASLGHKAGLEITAPQAWPPAGRRVTVGQIADGAMTGNGTVTHWAITSTTGGQLLAAGSLAAGFVMRAGSVFTLPAFDIGILGAQ